MRILITGITGRIGANLASSLVAAGHTVRGLVWARDRRTEKLADLDVELVEGSLTDAEDVRSVVDGMDIVCHLGAAFQGGGPFTNEEYFEINVRGTLNVLEAVRSNSAGIKQFFFASSDALYEKYLPGGVPEPISEDRFPLRPKGAYAVTKHLAEDLCMGYGRTYGLPVTVFRFAMTMAGEEILSFPQFYLSYWLDRSRAASDPAGVQVYEQLKGYAAEKGNECLVIARTQEGVSYKKHIADVRDIVAGFECAIGREEAVGQVFQLAAPRPFVWSEVVPYLAERLGLPAVDVRMSGQAPTFYEFDMSKGARLIGFEPTVDVFEMIDSALAMRAGD